MYNTELLQAIDVTFLVSRYLFNTNRVLKAIEVCKEHLFLLNHKTLENEKNYVTCSKMLAYEKMLVGYYLIYDHRNAIECGRKLLVISQEIGQSALEGRVTLALAILYTSQCKYNEAEQLYIKALNIATETGEKEVEAVCYTNLGKFFVSLGEYVKAKEYQEKALAIAEKIGHRKIEAQCYGNLGGIFQLIGEYVKAKEYHEKALAIADKNGDVETVCYANLGSTLVSLGEHVKAKEYQEKALAIAEKNGDRESEAACCGKLGAVFLFLGEYVKAKDYLERALELSRETRDINKESQFHWLISLCMMLEGNIHEAKSHFVACINKKEAIRSFLKDHDQLKISYFDKFGSHYRGISHLLCRIGNPYEGLYIEEIGRAKALADLMSAQYSIENELHVSVNPKLWVGIEGIVEKEGNCACVYISYLEKSMNLWVVKADNQLFVREIEVNNALTGKGSVRKVADVFCSEIYRKVHCLFPEQCEDRSCVFPSNVHRQRTRLVEEDEDEQQPILTLADGYKMIIAPVADLLDKPEIIIVPDRLLFKVPFAAKGRKRRVFVRLFQDPLGSFFENSQAHSGQSSRLSQSDWCIHSWGP